MSTPVITLKSGQIVKLTYDKTAIFYADEVGAWEGPAGSVGFARATKFVWAMLPEELRLRFPSPVALAPQMPPANVAWEQIHLAISAAGPEMEAKNVLGSMNGPTPSSSSKSPAKNRTGS